MKTNQPIPRCSKCGELLEVNEMGVPVKSLWKDGKWFCPKCWKGKQND